MRSMAEGVSCSSHACVKLEPIMASGMARKITPDTIASTVSARPTTDGRIVRSVEREVAETQDKWRQAVGPVCECG